MIDPDVTPAPPVSALRQVVSRRSFLVSAGIGALSLTRARSAFGSRDKGQDGHGGDDDYGGDDHGGRDDDSVQPSGTVPAGSAEVIINDDDADAFEPGTITINVGESVTWVNLDNDPHSATGEDFDTGRIEPGGLATVTFDRPGVFPYSCQYHPVMTGTVEVRDASGRLPAGSASSPEASPAATPRSTPRSGTGSTVEVEIEDFAFNPPELTLSTGMTVRWTNRDTAPHTATSSAKAFDSGRLDKGQSFEHTFTEPGTFEYVCAFHPNMLGRIIVTT
jgi:plastocyanin